MPSKHLFVSLIIISTAACHNPLDNPMVPAPSRIADISRDSAAPDNLKTAAPTHSQDADTALCVFLYDHYQSQAFDDHFEAFSHWETEHEATRALMLSLYHSKKDIDRVLAALENSRARFRAHARAVLLTDYRDSHVLSGMPLDFLLSIGDSVALSLLNDALKNPKVNSDEKMELQHIRSKIKG